MKKIATSLLLLVILLQTNAQQVSIIPQPTKITQEAQGTATINAQTVIVLASADLAPSANFLNDYFCVKSLRIVRSIFSCETHDFL